MQMKTVQELCFLRELREAFHQERTSRGLTQRELGKRIDVATVTIGKFESGDAIPSLMMLRQYCRGIGLPLHKLMAMALRSSGWQGEI